MSSINAPINYTNKDFVSIYEELLQLGKELSYKWDPTQTNESDPGLVLIKEKAIVGDKNNYNIDKNILQAFPDTVTEEKVARQLFSQLGYKMPWYIGATTDISFKWIGDTLDTNQSITIPQYSMVTDSEGHHVYTLLEPVNINWTTKNYITTVKAIQGVYTKFKVANSYRVTTNNIDMNNRLYLNDYNIAQNGIFINNVDIANVIWTQVDNIHLYPNGSYIYEFGVDPNTNLCYLEFPKDYDELIGSGINVNYILTDGSDGNISSKVLNTFYNDISVTLGQESITLNEENIQFYNISSANDGANPQELTAAYNSYKRTVGTFNTLVTLRDYMNAIYNSRLVSNVKVSDRFHDIQTTYQILTDKTGIDTLETYFLPKGTNDNLSFQRVSSLGTPTWSDNTYYKYDSSSKSFALITGEPIDWSTNYLQYYVLVDKDIDLTAYDLRLYLLKSSGGTINLSTYDQGFELEPSKSKTSEKVKDYINNSQCVAHDFKDILPDIPCLYRNIFPLNIKIIPQYKLNETQQLELKMNIFYALLDALQAKNMNFGEEPDYEYIYNVILNSDARIKTIILDDFTYTTYATYWDDSDIEDAKFKHIPVSDFTDANIIVRDTLAELNTLVTEDNNIVDDINNTIIEAKSKYLYIAKYDTDREGNIIPVPVNNCYIYKDKDKDDTDGTLEKYSDKIQVFRKDIVAKNVLAGNTTLFKQDNQFSYNILQDAKPVQQDVSRVTTKLNIAPMGGELDTEKPGITNIYDSTTNFEIKPVESNYPTDNSYGDYVLNDNESIQIYGPSFKSTITYSNYIKFLVVLEKPTGFTYNPKRITQETQISYNNPVYKYDENVNDNIKYTSNAIVSFKDADGNTRTGNIKQAAMEGFITLYDQVEGRTIAINSEYELRDNDSFYVFYRESDEDNAPYKYRKYAAGKVIRPNFTLEAKSLSDTLINNVTVRQFIGNIIGESGNIKYSPDINSPFGIINNLYGDNNLSGTKSIDLREINQVQFQSNSGEHYYFVTNTISDDKENYELILSKSSTNLNNYEYILKSNEYFIHSDRNYNTYEVAGAGTLIRLTLDTASTDKFKSFSNKIVENYLIETEGLTAVQEHMIQISSGTMMLREQQIFNLVSGNKLIISLGSNYYDKEDNEPIDWRYSDTNEKGLPSIELKETRFQIDSNSIKCTANDKNLNFNLAINNDGDKYIVSPNVSISELSSGLDDEYKKYSITTNECYVMEYKAGYYYEPIQGDSVYPSFKLVNSVSFDSFKSYYEIPLADFKFDPKQHTVDLSVYAYFIKRGSILERVTQLKEGENYSYAVLDNIRKGIYNFESDMFYKKAGTTNITYKLADKFSDLDEDNGYESKTCYILSDIEEVEVDATEEVDTTNIFRITGINPSEFKVSYQTYATKDTPLINTDSICDLKGVDISYSEADEESSPIIPLPNINIVDNDSNWKATATLNLNSSPIKSQKITTVNKESTTIKSTQIYAVNDKALNSNDNDIFINTNVQLELPGGNNVDVRYYDIFGNYHNINILPYINDNDALSADGEGNIVVNIFNNLNGESFNFNTNGITLSKSYNYILPVKNESDKIKYKLEINVPTGIDINISPYALGTFYGEGVQYYMFRTTPNSDLSEVKFSLTFEPNSNETYRDTNANIIIYPLVRYVDTSLFAPYGLKVDDIIEHMKELDKDSIFKWNYMISEGKLIKNPLDAKSFFNENHVCNSFTIGKAEMDFYSIGSQLDIINNR